MNFWEAPSLCGFVLVVSLLYVLNVLKMYETPICGRRVPLFLNLLKMY